MQVRRNPDPGKKAKSSLLKKIIYPLIFAFCVFILLFSALFNWDSINSYYSYNTSSLSYVRARVISIDAENLTKDSIDESRYLGTQTITVRILSGEFAGEEIEITNNLSRTWNVLVKENEYIIVCADNPDNADAYFTVYNHDRTAALLAILLIFSAAVVIVGGFKGLRTLVSLGFAVLFIFLFFVQSIYHGFSIYLVTAASLLVICSVTLVLLNGLGTKTFVTIISTFIGVLIAGLFCVFSQSILRATGYNLDDCEALVLISQSTGLEVGNILFACVLISSLGAVMDVAVSIVSSLGEVFRVNSSLSAKELFSSGMTIGRDMIGTMSNTLILAFTGTSITTAFLLIAYGYQTNQLLSSDFVALEIIQAISSTFAVIMTVPLSSMITAFFLKRGQRNGKPAASI